MDYPKKKIRLSALVKMGYSKKELKAIYRNRSLNKDFKIASKITPGIRNSPIEFDIEALEKYWKFKCTGE